MDTVSIRDLKKEMKKSMDDSRYEHTLGVMYTSAALAMRYGYDIDKALLAGLMHDCAKCMPNAKKLKTAEKNGLEISELERKHPFMLHAKVGELLARKKYDIDDEEVLGAIRWHTTGRPDMTLLEKIVYVADYIEPKREKAPNLKEIRQLAFVDLDRALLKILEDTLGYLGDSADVDPMTKATWDFYRQMLPQEQQDGHAC
ncbi:MAG: bis(5'-nucleosyl)-tetraphosphatase (symmetrical) YqeK [Lachnospiraceae bacterium]|nr:bis(5'-nucleosyl)-tetraphosphatase (symmetrical) YqeK [Lachnospiraceae bacterium]